MAQFFVSVDGVS